MKTVTALRFEGEITEDGQLHVDLPSDVLRGPVLVTLEPLPEETLELTEEDLQGAGLTAAEIALSPEIGAWVDDLEIPSGAEYVERIRAAPC
ncbi:MAG TPA: hypothetical protein VN851_18355 [Thermoanaerobaculia bacterium]|nr:hypothetical protein [Thermoanaerobaculia bacterium]